MVYRSGWEAVSTTHSAALVRRHFGTDLLPSQSTEMFCVDGVPMAAFVYTENNTLGAPIVDSFLLRKERLLSLNVGPIMRSQLYDRHRHLNLSHAFGADVFLVV